MRIIIVGGGFAGINLALSLAHNIKFQVLLVDKNSSNFFPPFLYQITKSFLEPSQISNPFLKLFSGKDNLVFHQGELERVVPTENKIVLRDGELEYDYLVLATGTETNFSGLKNLAEHAFPLKTLEDSLKIRKHLSHQIEKASASTSEDEIYKLLTLVIAGGGASGVELSATLAEAKRKIIHKKYPELSKYRQSIFLIERQPEILSVMPEISKVNMARYLNQIGIEVLHDTDVIDFTDSKVLLSSGDSIETENLFWTAGTKGRKIRGFSTSVYGKDNRILVDRFNKVVDSYNIFSIGDMCLQEDSDNFPGGHPQVAQVAIQQGINLAKNFQRMAEQQPLEKFVYDDPGYSLNLGEMKAVAHLNRFNLDFNGITAWLISLFVHRLPMTRHGSQAKMLYYTLQSYLFKS